MSPYVGRHRRVVPPRRRRSRAWALAVVVLAATALVSSSTATTSVPPTGPPPVAPGAAPPLTAARPVHLRIASIAVDAALVDLGLQPDGSLQVPRDGTVAGWYTGSPTPGQLGPAIVAAHVDWNHQPGVFFHLRELRHGDEVDIDRRDGTTARFEVTEVEQYGKDAFPTDRVYGDPDHPGLRLVTCGGAFTGAAGGYQDNIVVYAGLVGAEPAPVRAPSELAAS